MNRDRLTDRRGNRLVVAKVRQSGAGTDWELGVSRCKLSYTEWINSKVLLCIQGNYTQYPVINQDGEEYKGNIYYINIYWLPRCCSGKDSVCECRRCKRHGFNPWVRRIPRSRNWPHTPVFWLENSRDREAWRVTVQEVAEGQTRLSN